MVVKPIIKFNGGIGAIICNKCRVIIKEHLTKEEIEGKTDLLYCDDCKNGKLRTFAFEWKTDFGPTFTSYAIVAAVNVRIARRLLSKAMAQHGIDSKYEVQTARPRPYWTELVKKMTQPKVIILVHEEDVLIYEGACCSGAASPPDKREV